MIIGMIYGYHDNFMTKVRVSSVQTVSSVHFISTGHESTQNIFIYLKNVMIYVIVVNTCVERR